MSSMVILNKNSAYFVVVKPIPTSGLKRCIQNCAKIIKNGARQVRTLIKSETLCKKRSPHKNRECSAVHSISHRPGHIVPSTYYEQFYRVEVFLQRVPVHPMKTGFSVFQV